MFTHVDINVACIGDDPKLELALKRDPGWFAEHVIFTFPQVQPPLDKCQIVQPAAYFMQIKVNISP